MLPILIVLFLSVHARFRSDGILIYCKKCSENVTTSDQERFVKFLRINLIRGSKNEQQLINIKSEQSVSLRNESFAFEHGIIVQEFINPGGYHFDLITVKRNFFDFFLLSRFFNQPK